MIDEIELFSARELRRAATIGLSALVLLAGGLAYARPWTAAARPRPAPAATPAPPEPLVVSALDFTSSSSGWALGGPANSPSHLLHTTDGGRHWSPAKGAPAGFLTGLRFFDSRHGYLLAIDGTSRQLYVTADAGAHWQASSLPIAAASFVDARNGFGIVVGDPGQPRTVYRTADGGLTWRPAGSGPPNLGGLAFVDLRHGVGTVSDAGHLTVYRTADGGATWEPASLAIASPPSNQRFGLALPSAAGGRLVVMTPGSAQVSLDGGATWSQPAQLPAGAALIAPNGDWYVLGPAILWHSSDLGRSWASRSMAVPAGLRPAQLVFAGPSGLWARAFLDQSDPGFTAPTARTAQALLHSSDAGAHWTRVELPALRAAT